MSPFASPTDSNAHAQVCARALCARTHLCTRTCVHISICSRRTQGGHKHANTCAPHRRSPTPLSQVQLRQCIKALMLQHQRNSSSDTAEAFEPIIETIHGASCSVLPEPPALKSQPDDLIESYRSASADTSDRSTPENSFIKKDTKDQAGRESPDSIFTSLA